MQTSPESEISLIQPTYPKIQPYSEAESEEKIELLDLLTQEQSDAQNDAESQKIEKTNIVGLINFLEEQGIDKMECPGADKPVILVKNNALISIQLSLNDKEIKDMLEEARGPGNNQENIIKARINGWNFTGLISEFGGNRFILER